MGSIGRKVRVIQKKDAYCNIVDKSVFSKKLQNFCNLIGCCMDINKIGTTFAISNAYCRLVSHTKTALWQVPEVKTVV